MRRRILFITVASVLAFGASGASRADADPSGRRPSAAERTDKPQPKRLSNEEPNTREEPATQVVADADGDSDVRDERDERDEQEAARREDPTPSTAPVPAPARAPAPSPAKHEASKRERTPSTRAPARTALLDDVMARTLPNGCRYTANIKGRVVPTKVDRTNKTTRPGEVDPDITIDVSVACPHSPAVRVVDTVTRTAPLTWKELEAAVERRAAVFLERAGARCVIMPDLEMSARGITMTHVSQLCPADEPAAGR